ncbi:MFS transporter [Isoptericola sp. b441]|uniref:MFS transporter n=2 Tax=Actinotalea lenta TaxID=3064654 RepID=A0ABT9D791_9CELL|nr:MFS transporter [Isoptericola sp. b441]MDO8106715.1 MFS transporter [Isoptericola sp. b441]MDO8121573.1 MFS transporter [Isoptericola sp. b490]
MSVPDLRAQVRGSRAQALWLATLGFFGGFAGVSIFGPLVPKFTDLIGLSPFAAGMLAAIPSLTGSLLRIPFGAAVDRMGGKKPFLTLLVAANLGVVGLLVLLGTSYPDGMAGSYPLLLVLGALIGCGIATFSVGIGQVSYWYPRSQQGGALGTYAGLGNTSPGLSSMLLPLAVGGIGMLGAYSVWFAILLALTLAYLLLIKDAPVFQLRARGVEVPQATLAELGGGETAPGMGAWEGLKHAARIPATWVLTFFYFLSFGGFLAFTSWLPTFWHAMYGSELRTAGLLTASFSLLSALIRVPGGILSDRVSIRFALAGNFVLMLLGTVVLAFSGSFVLSLIATMAVGAGMGLQNAIVFKLLPRYIPDAVGGASGWIGGLGALGGFVIPPVMGIVTGAVGGAVGYARGFLPFAVLVAVALPVVALLHRWDHRAED